MLEAPWPCTILCFFVHKLCLNKLMQCFYWSVRSKWYECYWTCALHGPKELTKTYNKRVFTASYPSTVSWNRNAWSRRPDKTLCKYCVRALKIVSWKTRRCDASKIVRCNIIFRNKFLAPLENCKCWGPGVHHSYIFVIRVTRVFRDSGYQPYGWTRQRQGKRPQRDTKAELADF